MLKCRKYRLSMSSSGETVKMWGYFAPGAVVQKTDYYPYGSPMASSTGEEANRYKFGEKEYETRLGLSFHNFEARMLFNDRLAFNRPDDLAGDTPWLSPYIYCAANPIRYIDPTGNYFQLAGTNPEREDELFNRITDISNSSPIFSIVYNYLENLDTPITLGFGPMRKDDYGDPINGKYESKTNTITYSIEKDGPDAPVLIEEIYHCYQELMPAEEKDSKEWNREFEVKIISVQICMEADLPCAMSTGSSILDTKLNNDPNYIYSSEFEQIYVSEGQKFIPLYNGNDNYTVPINSFPKSLKNLINQANQQRK